MILLISLKPAPAGLNIGSPVCSAACGTECGGLRWPHHQNPRGDGFVGGFECIRRGCVDIDQLLPFVIKNPYSFSLSIFASPKTD